MHLPRIGQEVIVSFYGGDPDQPIVTGSVFNAMNTPPWSLPDQQALSGFRSRELMPGGGNSAAGRSNHLILDDTEQKIQAQLKSDHAHSQLSLGHITRIANNQGRQDARGEEKDWAKIASNYNGPSCNEFSYDTKLAQAYIEIKKKGIA